MTHDETVNSNTTAPCIACDGCGQVANTEDKEPWTDWANLPLGSSMAVLTGVVKPIPCPECGGTGDMQGPVTR